MTIATRLHGRIKSLERRVVPEAADDLANLDDHALLTRVRAMLAGNPQAPWECVLGEPGMPLGHRVQSLLAVVRQMEAEVRS